MFRLFCWIMVILLPSCAAAQTAMLPSDVSVDITADDAAEARTQAMAKAEIEGFTQLLDRLAPDQKNDILQHIEVKQISGMVRGVEVREEKITGNRYRATLRVNYDAVAFNTLVGAQEQQGVPAVALRSSAIMIIPVYAESGKEMLWEKGNPWLDTWRRVAVEKGNGSLVTPYGDAEDVARLTAGGAQTAEYGAFAPLIGRYGVAQVAMLKAAYSVTPQPHVTLTRRLLSSQRTDVETLEYQADPQEDRDALLRRAARDVAEQLEQYRAALASDKALENGTAGRQLVIIPIGTLYSWTNARQKLENMPSITKVEIRAIASNQGDAFLHYKGNVEGLEAALKAGGFRVQKNANYWILTQ